MRVLRTEVVRHVVIDEDEYRLCLEHREAYKKAKAELSATAWWRLLRRTRLSRQYITHLRACVDHQHKGLRFVTADTIKV